MRKRRLTRRLLWRGGAFQVRQLLKAMLGRHQDGGMRFPSWYES
jgi:hypothetical protein